MASSVIFKLCHRFSIIIIFLSIFTVIVKSNQVKNLSPNPIGGRFVPVIRPSQSLLPPHREEGQSLDDIIYGFSSPLLRTPVPVTTTTTTQRPTIFITSESTPLTPSSNFGSSSTPFIPTNGAFGFQRNRFNDNLVQTFTPPPPPSTAPPQQFQSTVRSPFANSLTPNSAEEIKVPQPVKLRSEKKQYTKADLVAAANMLKPAGFDFSKVLIITPSNFQNRSVPPPLPPLPRNENLRVPTKSVEKVEDNSLSPLYHSVMFPLPLFDTPVFRPIMEMLLKQQQAKFGQLTTSDNKKVLVIIPKSAGLGSAIQAARSVNGNGQQQQQRDQRSNQQQQKFATSKPIPSASRTNSKLVIVPKEGKATPTSKPKPRFVTTKRITKQAVPVTTAGKSKEKGSDLQVAATSNKLSQSANLRGASPSSTEKRSYSLKGDDKYSFSYAVKNDAYGDVKSHSESRDGDQVEGSYSMLEADGYTRVVRYTVDADQGFKASVKRIPPS